MTAIIRRALPVPTIVLGALALLGVASCGGAARPLSGQRQPVASRPLAASPKPLAGAPRPAEVGVYRAGPLTLAVGEDLAEHPEEWSGRRRQAARRSWADSAAAPRCSERDGASRRRFSLQFTPTGRPTRTLGDAGASVSRCRLPGWQLDRL